MSAMAGVSDAAIAVRDRIRGKIGITRVRRYRRGTLPEWASDLNGADDYGRTPRAASVLNSVSPRRHCGARDDRHLGQDQEELRGDLQCVRLHGKVVPAAVDLVAEPRDVDAAAAEDDEAQDERRRRILERWLLQKREEEDVLPKGDEELAVESESNSESEDEADSEEEEVCIAVGKPVFVPKPRRDTVVERERIEEERRQLEELVKRRMEERKVETRRIVVEVIIKDEHIDRALSEEAEAIDTDDDADEAKEYETWKNREIERIKRDRVARLKEGEIEKVVNTTVENMETGNSKPIAKDKKMKFMQRYYHRGAFFQEKADDGSQMSYLDDIYKRDFSAPTGEDKMDKSILPMVMQVKQFGRRGRVKWTHLVSEDTTDRNNPYVL